MRPLKFSTLTQAVIRAYANEVPQELAYDIFDTFPYSHTSCSIDRDIPYLLLTPYLNLYAVMDGTDTITRIDCISHIEPMLRLLYE